MKPINLRSLAVENFKSFIELTTILFSNGPGLKLITGENEVEPQLGANGCGKSTIFEALCFCLYGSGIHGERAADLITDGKKNTKIAATFQIADETVTISRTAPPDRRFINDEPAEQYEIEQIIGLSKQRFLNSVIFGQDTNLFIDLSIPARGELLDEVLDLAYWMRAAQAATTAYNKQNSELATLRISIARLQGQIEGLEDISAIEQREAEFVARQQTRIEDLITQIEVVENELVGLSAEYNKKMIAAEKIQVQKLYKTHQARREIESNLRRSKAVNLVELEQIHERIQFFADNPTCPACGQNIAEDFEHDALAELERKRSESRSLITKLETQITEAAETSHATHQVWQEALAKHANLGNETTRLHEQIKARNERIDNLTAQVENIAGEPNPHTAQKQRALKLRDELQASLVTKQTDEKSALIALAQFDFWRQGFRRVRLFCLKRVLRQLELEANNAAAMLGLVGWRIECATETETKSETLKTGIQIITHSPFAVRKFCSGGEEQRVKLCVALGLANLIQRYSGVTFAFEVWDEPPAWYMSVEGFEALLVALANRAMAYGKSTWLCDHRAPTFSGFAETWVVRKTSQGSRMELLQ